MARHNGWRKARAARGILLGLALMAGGCASAAGGPEVDRLTVLDPTEQMQAAVQAHASGDYEQAAEGFSRAADALQGDPPNRAKALANLGAALIGDGRYEKAVAALEEAKSIDPRQYQTRFNLGRAYTKLGRLQDARLSYMAAGQLAPDNPDVPYNLGILYEIYLNQPEDALDAYRDYLAKGGAEATRVQVWITAIELRQATQ